MKYVRVRFVRREDFEVIAQVDTDLEGHELCGRVAVPDDLMVDCFGQSWEGDGWQVEDVTQITEDVAKREVDERDWPDLHTLQMEE